MAFCPNVEVLTQNMQNAFDSLFYANKIGNAAVSVMQNGRTLYRGYFGSQTFNGAQKPNEKSLFRLASMTKPVTAVAVLMQAEKDLLDLDADISAYLPAFSELYLGKNEQNVIVKTEKLTNGVTVRQLLTHTSGIGSGLFGELQLRQMPQDKKTNLADAVAYYATLPLLFAPGTRTEYSPIFAFDILARLVEVTAKQSFSEFLKNELFTPLEMHDTVFEPNDEQKSRLVFMHDKKDGKSVDATASSGELFPGIPNSRFCGGASLASTLNDYEIFAQMLLHNGTYKGKKILSPASVAQMATPQVSEQIMPGSQRWGLGVRVIAEKSYCYLPVGSYGWSGAHGTHFWVDPENEITAVLMRNSLVDGGAGARTAVQFEKLVYTAK